MARRTLLLVSLAGLLALGAAATDRSSAATLGGLQSRTLGAWTLVGGTGAPIVGLWDGFTRPNGTNLNGQASGGNGPVWQAVAGTWSTVSGSGRLTSNTADGALAADCGAANSTVVVTLSMGSSFSAGVMLKHLPGIGFLAVDHSSESNGRLDLVLTLLGGRTVLASATNVGRTSPATLAVTYDDGTITVQLNGVTRLTHTLSIVNQWIYGGSTRVGLYADRDTQTTFDNFRCEHR